MKTSKLNYLIRLNKDLKDNRITKKEYNKEIKWVRKNIT